MTSAGPSTSGEGPVRLLGAVLAGGGSRRFGRDKTAEPVGGVPMVERAVATLEGLCDEVVVVSSRAATPKGRWRIVPDLRPGEGPLAGLEAALAEAENLGYDGAFVLAADLPLVDRATLVRLVEALDGGVAVAAAPGSGDVEGVGAVHEDETVDERAGGDEGEAVDGGESSAATVQPLCAVYRVACSGPAKRLLDEGRRDARALLEAVGGRILEVDPARLLNVNTPEALTRVEEKPLGAGSGAGDESGIGEEGSRELRDSR